MKNIIIFMVAAFMMASCSDSSVQPPVEPKDITGIEVFNSTDGRISAVIMSEEFINAADEIMNGEGSEGEKLQAFKRLTEEYFGAGYWSFIVARNSGLITECAAGTYRLQIWFDGTGERSDFEVPVHEDNVTRVQAVRP